MATHPGKVDFTNEIIAACIKNYAYDGQCESSRAPYLYRIIKANGKEERIKKVILKAIEDEARDTWTLTQLFDLARHFASEGDSRFRHAIYQRFYRKIITGSDWVGYDEILRLDGLAGLEYIATTMGQGMLDNPDNWQDDWILRSFADMYPAIDGRVELAKRATNSPQIQKYLSGIDEVKSLREKNKVTPQVYSDLLEEVKNRRIPSPFRKRVFTEDQLLSVATALVQEKEPKYIEKMLYFFSFFKFPLASSIILTFAKRRKSSKNSIVERAVEALEFLSSDAIRGFAVDRIQNATNPEDYSDLFINNYRLGDAELLSKIAVSARDDHVIEQLARSYSRIYEANLTSESRDPLQVIYNKMTCGNCRELVVKSMLKNNVVPSEMVEELQYDSNEEIRKLCSNLITSEPMESKG